MEVLGDRSRFNCNRRRRVHERQNTPTSTLHGSTRVREVHSVEERRDELSDAFEVDRVCLKRLGCVYERQCAPIAHPDRSTRVRWVRSVEKKL
jgi:hypothetical protein